MIKRVLVGTRNGRRVMNWPAVLLVGLVVGLASGAAGAMTWFLLTGKFSLFALTFPAFLFVGIFWGQGIQRGFSAPLERLPRLD